MTGPRSVSVDEVRERLEVVRSRLAGAGDRPVEVVAVTKGFDRSAVVAALTLGLSDLGENYAQELLDKVAALGGVGPHPEVVTPEWHFLGRLQRNKVRRLAPVVALWQSVDRVELGAEIARRAPGAAVLVQVNVSGEPQKGGCAPADAPHLVTGLRGQGLDVRGLMAVGPSGPPEGARPAFRLVASLADELGLAERSMGMSDDLEVAVEEGSTMVRLGRALFGSR